MVYLPTFTIKLTIHIGKYNSPMDPSWDFEGERTPWMCVFLLVSYLRIAVL